MVAARSAPSKRDPPPLAVLLAGIIHAIWVLLAH